MAILEGKKVTKRFAGLVAVDKVDFELKQGEILGLIGPNGAGKTTLVNVIAGAYPPSDGDILFMGKRVTAALPFLFFKAHRSRKSSRFIRRFAPSFTAGSW